MMEYRCQHIHSGIMLLSSNHMCTGHQLQIDFIMLHIICFFWDLYLIHFPLMVVLRHQCFGLGLGCLGCPTAFSLPVAFHFSCTAYQVFYQGSWLCLVLVYGCNCHMVWHCLCQMAQCLFQIFWVHTLFWCMRTGVSLHLTALISLSVLLFSDMCHSFVHSIEHFTECYHFLCCFL